MFTPFPSGPKTPGATSRQQKRTKATKQHATEADRIQAFFVYFVFFCSKVFSRDRALARPGCEDLVRGAMAAGQGAGDRAAQDLMRRFAGKKERPFDGHREP